MFFDNLIPPFLTEYYIFRLLIASILGALVGIERDMHGRAAGLRTNMLVSLGAALFMIISETIANSYGDTNPDSLIRVDPARIAAQIVTGIGFIGAGSIIKSGFTIRGLTTAACLWLSAGIGMSAGAGLYELAILTAFLGVIGIVIFNSIEKFFPKNSYRILEITTSNNGNLSEIINSIKTHKLRILHLDQARNYSNDEMVLKFSLRLFNAGLTDKISDDIVKQIEKLKIDVRHIKWYRL